MAEDIPAFHGMSWAALGDTGQDLPAEFRGASA
jgi:hypothetical protein